MHYFLKLQNNIVFRVSLSGRINLNLFKRSVVLHRSHVLGEFLCLLRKYFFNLNRIECSLCRIKAGGIEINLRKQFMIYNFIYIISTEGNRWRVWVLFFNVHISARDNISANRVMCTLGSVWSRAFQKQSEPKWREKHQLFMYSCWVRGVGLSNLIRGGSYFSGISQISFSHRESKRKMNRERGEREKIRLPFLREK